MLNFVLVWMLMTVQSGGVQYSPATDLESCQRMQKVVIEANTYTYSKCIQIRVDPRQLK